ncbi:MAG: transposase domain-containing protein [Bryobacteraceae bacterium]
MPSRRMRKFRPDTGLKGKVREVLKETKRTSIRERDLPAHVVVYITSSRWRCLLEGVQWLLDPSVNVKVAGKSGISQARSRLAAEPVKKLYDAIVAPIAEKRTKGAWYRQWRVISLDAVYAASVAVRWMWPIPRKTRRPLGVREPIGVPALSPRSVSWRCWRTARTYYGMRTCVYARKRGPICHR